MSQPRETGLAGRRFAGLAQNLVGPVLVGGVHVDLERTAGRDGGLMAMNGLLGISSSMARMVGGPLGGLVFGLTGLGGVIMADACTFLVAALLLAPWPSRRPPGAVAPTIDTGTASAVSSSVFRGWLEGLSVVFGTPILRRAMGVVNCMALAQGAFVVLFVLFVVRDLSGDATDVGILRGVQAIGAVAGGALLAVLVRHLDARSMLPCH